MFTMLMDNYIPSNYTIEQKVRKLVEHFGITILYCFIEAARPIDNAADKGQGREYRENLVLSCIENMIPIEFMYRYFLAILDHTLSPVNENNGSKRQENSL